MRDRLRSALDPEIWRTTLDDNLMYHLDAERKTLERYRAKLDTLDGDEAPTVEGNLRGLYEDQCELVAAIEKEAASRGLIKLEVAGF